MLRSQLMDFLYGDVAYYKRQYDSVLDELIRHHIVNKFIRDMEDVLLECYLVLDTD
jgi:hypothetical protein